MYHYRRLLISTITFVLILSGVTTMSTVKVEAIDCPALQSSDVADRLEGAEVISTDGTLSYGVRLLWNDPLFVTPRKIHIYRKAPGEGFTKIGTVSRGVETFMDKTTKGRVPAYIYTLQSEFTCGGTTWSKPITVGTIARFDTTGPYTKLLTKGNTSSLNTTWVYIEDQESGIQQSSIRSTINKKNQPIQTFGTNQKTLLKLNSSNLVDGDNTLHIEVKNGSGIALGKGYGEMNIEHLTSTGNISIASPKAGSALPTYKALPLTITNQEKGTTLQVSASFTLGETWLEVPYEETEDNLTLNIHSIAPEKSSILLLHVAEYKDGALYAEDMAPYFYSPLTLDATSTSTTFDSTEQLMMYDAFTGSKVILPVEEEENGYLGLWDTSKHITISTLPGTYFIKEQNKDFYISSSRFLDVSHARSTKISLQPKSHYFSGDKKLSQDDIMILSDKLLPEPFLRFISTFENITIPTVGNSEEVLEMFSDTIFISTTLCTESTCVKQKFTPKEGESHIDITLMPQQEEFVLSKGQQQKETLTNEVNNQSLIYIDVSSQYSFALPKVNNQPLTITLQKLEVADGGFAFKIEINNEYLSTIPAKHILISSTAPCQNHLLSTVDTLINQMKYLPTFCNGTSGNSLALFPLLSPILLGLSQGTGSNTSNIVQDWSAPYMSLLAKWELLYNASFSALPHTYITRGELAYMLRLSLGYQQGVYGSDQEFPDLPKEHPFTNAILGLVREGIMTGDDGGSTPTYRPDDNVNRAEGLKMILLAAHALDTNPKQTSTFTDVSTNAWYFPFVQRSNELALVEGYLQEDGTREFRPSQYITRAEAAKLIISILKLQVSTLLQ